MTAGLGDVVLHITLYPQLCEAVSEVVVTHVNQQAEMTQKLGTEDRVLDVGDHIYPPEGAA